MKKDEVLKRREEVLKTLNTRLEALGWAPLVDDGKLYHDELEGEGRWVQRLSRPSWPHVAKGQGPNVTPGLRYELWYYQRQSVVWMGLVCPPSPVLQVLNTAFEPQVKEWLASGKYAKRYRAVEGSWQRLYPKTLGICRALPIDGKLEDGMELLCRDTLPELDRILAQVDPEQQLAAAFKQAADARNPAAELASKFNLSRR